MKIASLATVVAFFLTFSGVHAGCYTSGSYFGDDSCETKIPRMCEFLSGPYNAYQTKYHCWNTPLTGNWEFGFSTDFRIFNNQNAAGYVTYDSCLALLALECDCSQGGISYYYGGPTGNWEFQVDPQWTSCPTGTDGP